MKPLPRVPFAGRLCRIQVEDGLGQVLRRLHQMTGHEAVLTPLDGTKWQAFWLRSSIALTVGSAEASDIDGSFAYPFLVRAAGDRYIVVSREAALVEQLLERGGVGGHVDSPRVQVDKAARELVFPTKSTTTLTAGRRYTIGAVYGAVEGYARALRSVSLFGDDLAEAELFQYALNQIIVTRIGLRDPTVDKELLSISSTGAVDFHFRGVQHLNAIDQLTTFMRTSGYIEWRQGKTWAPDMDQLPPNPLGEKQIS